MTIYILFATIITGFSGAHAVFGLQFAFLVVVSTALSAAIFVYATRHRAILTVALIAGSVAFVMAPLRDRLSPRHDASNRSPVAAAAAEPASTQSPGATLFQELGCSGCHRPDGNGIGPVLIGRFGGPASDGCGGQVIDEAYVREAILNPSATVAAGFAPVMPSFAGRLTEDNLQALVVYVKSLSVPARIQSR